MYGKLRVAFRALISITVVAAAACAPTPTTPGVPLPVLVVPADFTIVAERWFGADVDWSVSATVNDDPVPVNCDEEPGYYELGSTLVTCTARNSANGMVLKSFLFHVVANPEPEPLLDLPDGAAATSIDGIGANVSWTATALIGPALSTAVTCSPMPSYLPIGETTVTCTAGSPWGATSTGTFTATVREHITAFTTGGPTCAARVDGSVRCAPGSTAFGSTGVDVAVGDVVDLDRSHTHACYLLSDQTVACSGKNESGQLGDGTNAASPDPVVVTGLTNAVSISVGQGHSCATLSDGTARCWGDNSHGQLGDGTTANSNVPVAVAGLSNVVEVTAGGVNLNPLPPSGYLGFSCAVLADGSARCWGANNHSQLANGTSTDSPLPTAVLGVTDAVGIDAGARFACVQSAAGAVQCWGDNEEGQLGDGTVDDYQSIHPVVGLTNVVQFSTGYTHACAVLAGGTAHCWGQGSNGRLGNGAYLDAPVPVAVSGLSGVASIYAGAYATCALLDTDAAWCWGYNDAGELGGGPGVSSAVPVAAEF